MINNLNYNIIIYLHLLNNRLEKYFILIFNLMKMNQIAFRV